MRGTAAEWHWYPIDNNHNNIMTAINLHKVDNVKKLMDKQVIWADI